VPHRQCQPGEHRTAQQVDHDDQPPPVEPVHVDAADQREQQPWQLLGEDRAADQRGVAGKRREQQRAGREHHAVADVRDRAGRPQLRVLRAEWSLWSLLPHAAAR